VEPWLMVLEPTNWHATSEQPACQQIGRGTGELRAGGPGGASRAPEGQVSNRSSCTPLPGWVTLGRLLNPPKPWFPCLQGEGKNLAPSDGIERFNKKMPVSGLYNTEER